MDAYAEARLLKYIRSITKGRTSIIVSHRLSTIKMADRIILLKDGEVVEEGTYSQLAQNTKSHFGRMLQSLAEAMV